MLWEHHFCLFIYSQAIYGNYLSRAKIGVKDHHAGNNLFPVDGYQFRGVNVRHVLLFPVFRDRVMSVPWRDGPG